MCTMHLLGQKQYLKLTVDKAPNTICSKNSIKKSFLQQIRLDISFEDIFEWISSSFPPHLKKGAAD